MTNREDTQGKEEEKITEQPKEEAVVEVTPEPVATEETTKTTEETPVDVPAEVVSDETAPEQVEAPTDEAVTNEKPVAEKVPATKKEKAPKAEATDEKPVKEKKAMRQISKKGWIAIWSAAMAIFIVLFFGIGSIVLVSIPVRYGFRGEMALNTENINRIQIWNSSTPPPIIHTHDMHLRPQHEHAVNRSIQLFNQAGRTTRLHQIFEPGGRQQVTRMPGVPNNTTSANIRANSGNRYIHITFSTPQWSIHEHRDTRQMQLFPFGSQQAIEWGAGRAVHQAFIPLGGVPNAFVRHYVFLSTNQPPTDSVRYRFVTWGNFHNLARFVRDLELTN